MASMSWRLVASEPVIAGGLGKENEKTGAVGTAPVEVGYAVGGLMLHEETLGVKGGSATTACGCDGLTVVGVGNIACCKNAGNVGGGGVVKGLDVAGAVKMYFAIKEFYVGFVAYAEEKSVNGEVIGALGIGALVLNEVRSFQEFFSVETKCNGVEEYVNVALVKDTVLHDFGCAEVVLAHNQVNFGSDIAQIKGFLASGVATANYCHTLAAIEEAIACGAG